jgi:RNA polymerase sigma factor FliA
MQEIVYTELTEEQKLNPKVRGKIINDFAPLIKYIAARIAVRLPPHIDVNDLIDAGVIGLIDAIEKFDPDKRIKFKTYAEFRIRGAILDELRSMDWVPRSVRQKAKKIEEAMAEIEDSLGRPATDEETAVELGIDLQSYYHLLSETAAASLLSLNDLGDEEDDSSRKNLVEYVIQKDKDQPSHQLQHNEMAAQISEAIFALPEKEKRVISLYYYDELTMKEIGHVLKFTESRVSQIHTKAILRMRRRLDGVFQKINMRSSITKHSRNRQEKEV